MEIIDHIQGYDELQALTKKYLEEANKLLPAVKIVVIAEGHDLQQISTTPQMYMYEIMGILAITEVRLKIFEGTNLQNRLNAEQILKEQREALMSITPQGKEPN